MTTEESKLEILKQVEAGILTPEEGAGLLGILDGARPSYEEPTVVPEVIAAPAPEVDQYDIPWYWKAGWSLFLWLGVGLTVLSAYWMYRGYEAAGFGVGFILSWIPFLLGIVLTYAGARLIQSHWVHVKVNSTENGRPQNIDISLPLPLGFAGWIFKNFGQFMPQEIREKHIDEMLSELEGSIKKGEPFHVHVDDDESGDKVEVLII